MIDVKKLTNRDVGREVIYTSSNDGDFKGTIVSWNIEKDSVYIKYDDPIEIWLKKSAASEEINDITGLSTNPYLVKFVEPPKPKEIVTRAELFIFDED